MYRLLEDFDRRPSLAPPLSIFENIYQLSKACWKATCRKKRTHSEILLSNTNAFIPVAFI